MKLITPILEDYRKKHRVKQVGSYDGNGSKVITQSFRNKAPQVGIPYYFTPDKSLDGERVIITEIALVSAAEQPILLTSSGNIISNIPDTAYPQGYFVAVDAQQQIICQIPLYNLCARVNGGKPCYTWLETHIWENCYILLDNVTTFDSSHGLVWRITWLNRYV
jgi:hypothetical protein